MTILRIRGRRLSRIVSAEPAATESQFPNDDMHVSESGSRPVCMELQDFIQSISGPIGC